MNLKYSGRPWIALLSSNYLTVPLFHAAGLYCFLTTALYYETPVALPLPNRPLSADSVYETIENADVEAALLP